MTIQQSVYLPGSGLVNILMSDWGVGFWGRTCVEDGDEDANGHQEPGNGFQNRRPETRSDSLPPRPLGERGALDSAPRSIVLRFKRSDTSEAVTACDAPAGNCAHRLTFHLHPPPGTDPHAGWWGTRGWAKSYLVSHGDPIGLGLSDYCRVNNNGEAAITARTPFAIS